MAYSPKRNIPSVLQSLLKWDSTITNKSVKFIDQLFGPISKYNHILKGLEISCHGIPWLLGCTLCIFLFNFFSLRPLSVNIFIALLIDIGIVAVIKASTRRRRPLGNTKDMFATYAVDKFSFPSGHATRAVMLALLIPKKYNLIFPLPLLMVIWAACICVSRVLMRRHHILDVAGGVFIGWIEAVFIGSFIWLSEDSANALVEYF